MRDDSLLPGACARPREATCHMGWMLYLMYALFNLMYALFSALCSALATHCSGYGQRGTRVGVTALATGRGGGWGQVARDGGTQSWMLYLV